ncbi:MAG: DnaJ domain-containing protein [Haloferacaceae archaeon]
MDRDRLLLGLAAVFAGLTVALATVALAVEPFVLLLALPFGATAYFMWHQATGRLEERTRARADAAAADRARAASRGPRGGPWAEPGVGDGPGPGPGPDGARRAAPNADPGPSPAEAYRTLGLDPGASDQAVREAYRERVKEVHPDADSGDEEEFKRVTRAYETLRD